MNSTTERHDMNMMSSIYIYVIAQILPPCAILPTAAVDA